MPRGKKKVDASTEKQAAVAAPEAKAGTTAKGRGKNLSKTDAVRRALAKLGKKAMPKAIHDFVLTEFGMDINLSHVSNIKSTLKSNKGKAKKAMVHDGTPTAHAEKTEVKAVAHAGNGMKGVGIDLSDLQAVKALAQRIGTGNLHALIDLLAK
jgi:hypothetical protein